MKKEVEEEPYGRLVDHHCETDKKCTINLGLFSSPPTLFINVSVFTFFYRYIQVTMIVCFSELFHDREDFFLGQSVHHHSKLNPYETSRLKGR